MMMFCGPCIVCMAVGVYSDQADYTLPYGLACTRATVAGLVRVLSYVHASLDTAECSLHTVKLVGCMYPTVLAIVY